MRKFTDGKGRDWDIVINVGQVKKLRDVLNVDIDKVATQDGFRAFQDVVLFIDTIYLLCEKQCKERGLTDEQFGEGMVGDSLDSATDAFIQAIADFFPSHRRKLLQATADRAKAMQDQAMTKGLEIISKLTIDDLIPSKSPTNTQG